MSNRDQKLNRRKRRSIYSPALSLLSVAIGSLLGGYGAKDAEAVNIGLDEDGVNLVATTTCAGSGVSSGDGNICIGVGAGYSLSGNDNQVSGVSAGRYLSGNDNQVSGFRAGQRLSGNDNQVSGYQAGYTLSGNDN